MYPGAVSSLLTIDKVVYQQLLWLRGWLDDKKSLVGARTPKNCQINPLLSAEFSSKHVPKAQWLAVDIPQAETNFQIRIYALV